MIGTQELQTAFEAIGLGLRVQPTGLDFRVTPGEPGITAQVRSGAEGQPDTVELSVNFTRVVDLQVVELDVEERYLVLAADDWGDTLDAPPRVFRIGVEAGFAYVDVIRELSAED